MIYASLAAGVCCVLLGSQIHLQWAPHYFTAVCIYTFCVVYTLGAGTMPYVISAEVFLPEVSGLILLVYGIIQIKTRLGATNKYGYLT